MELEDRRDKLEEGEEWEMDQGRLEPVTTTERFLNEANIPYEFREEELEEVTLIDDFSHAGYPQVEPPAGVVGTLTFLGGEKKDQIHTLTKTYNVIGRNLDNELMIQGSTVSGRHAAVFLTRSLEWRIEDLDSTNGTVLNGSLVKRFVLSSGDKVLIGDTTLLFNEVKDEEQR